MAPSPGLGIVPARRPAPQAEGRRPAGPLLWVHAPPEDMTGAIAEIVSLVEDDLPGLCTLVTGPASAQAGAMFAAHGVGGALIRPAPPEERAAATDFAYHWRPDLSVWFPSTLARQLLRAAARAGAGAVLIGTGIPPAWHARWRPVGQRAMVRRFDRVFAADTLGAAIFQTLGIARERITVSGRLSESGISPGCNEAERAAMAKALAHRPAWLAYGATPEEDALVCTAHAAALRLSHRLLLLLAPDDPARATALAKALRKAGWRVAQRSADDEIDEETQIYLADTEGEDGLWYRLAPVAFLAGTLAAQKGRDPFPAASLGAAVVHGPGTGDFAPRYRRLAAAGAAWQVRDAQGLAEALETLLAPERAAAMAHAAWQVTTEGAEAAQSVADYLIGELRARGAG
ncbi:3-deoxy-D-manno-octulosonic-acid transferase [Rhodovulum iodosum]|uniref:3-deoxy-D-manno-octulosonic acid transferase n=1 Tax=Rhodovulum iodosum TaxID=68291 RepID=A0ABV3XSM6_9RHOB|nr:glycosyltransferase N-terminal domain-containing protein [Rhodovulum robiginosum]